MAKTIRVLISGRVQGVSYRAWTCKEARKLGIQGWVRNLSDGRVEAVFSGEEAIVSAMLEKCRRGSLLARVDSIEPFPCDESPEGFATKPTA